MTKGGGSDRAVRRAKHGSDPTEGRPPVDLERVRSVQISWELISFRKWTLLTAVTCQSLTRWATSFRRAGNIVLSKSKARRAVWNTPAGTTPNASNTSWSVRPSDNTLPGSVSTVTSPKESSTVTGNAPAALDVSPDGVDAGASSPHCDRAGGGHADRQEAAPAHSAAAVGETTQFRRPSRSSDQLLLSCRS
jgi:hypothetical protein